MEFINNNKRSILIAIVLICIICLLTYLLSNQETCNKCVKLDTNTGNTATSLSDQDTSISSSTPTIVCYYATWCGHSRMFLPEWEKFEETAKRELPNVDIKKIECSGDNETLCSNRGIGGFPTVVMYSGGKKVEYNGNRSTESLVSFCKQHI